MGHRRRRLLLVLVASTLVLGGCGGGRDADGDRAAGRAAEAPDGRRPLVSAQSDPRRVVLTADLTVRVGDAVRATEQATRITRDAGGLVFARRSDLDGDRESRLTLKVPPERFDPVLGAVADLGRALKHDARAQDVTGEVVDVEGRLRTAQASADRLRALIPAAPSTADIVAVEGELARREGEIESLQGRLRVLGSQVDLATIDVRLTEGADLEVSGEVPGFGTSLRAGRAAALNVVLVVVAATGFALPVLPIALAAWLVVRRVRSRRRSPAGA